MRACVKLYQLETPNKSTGMNEAGKGEDNVRRISRSEISNKQQDYKLRTSGWTVIEKDIM